MFKRSIAALAATVSMLAAAPASAGVILDQSDIPEAGHIDFSAAGNALGFNGIGQSFTAGVTGTLDHVAVDVAAWVVQAPAAGLRFQLQDAAHNTLFTRDFTAGDVPVLGFSGFDWEDVLNVDVRAAGIAVQAGQQFELRLSALGQSDAFTWRTGYSGQNISYAGGGATGYDVPPGFPGPVALGSDMGFRTYVDVPEPATWGLLIMGFAGVGASIRGRRRTALA